MMGSQGFPVPIPTTAESPHGFKMKRKNLIFYLKTHLTHFFTVIGHQVQNATTTTTTTTTIIIITE